MSLFRHSHAELALECLSRGRESRLGKVQTMLINDAKFLSCLDSRLRGNDGVIK